jgi:alpha-1,3-mannosyltransferase
MIAIGRLTQHKQLSKLVRMLPALRHLDPRWRLIIAGRTWDVEPTALNALAAADGVADGLQVVTGPSDADMAGLIRRASYLVSASSYEGFGLGVVEGMAAGLVPVLNRIPAFSSLVESTGCGVLVDFDDPAARAHPDFRSRRRSSWCGK